MRRTATRSGRFPTSSTANCLLCAALFRLALRALSTLREFMHEGATAMTSQSDSASSREPAASRRDFVTAVTAVAAASAAAATGSAQAQAGTNVRHSNPSGMTQPTAYSQVVEGQRSASSRLCRGPDRRRCQRKGCEGISRPGGAGVREHQDRTRFGRWQHG